MSSIVPYSRQALLYILSSDFLNPCPYELRYVKDEGSIKKTLEAAFPLLNTTGDDFISGRIERPVRPLYDIILRRIALTISALAIQIFLPPIWAWFKIN
ncbi:MAG: hypothetical protein H0T62_04025 [Parachlamydiaceae bacterium]|nr:hypothetical protein [Parachlamydiaceae bacterium]